MTVTQYGASPLEWEAPGARAARASTLPGLFPTLSIVIPALNEEASIAATVERCLEARERIRRIGRVREVTITVVSDGSTDRTAEIAQEIASREAAVSVIVFERNRGYGAAIKEGFSRSPGELVAFLDADGTCDPNYFAELCFELQRQQAAVALGSRMGAGSRMPRIRRLGNRIYALVLGSLSGRSVSDTASGMRVIRREALPDLYPLPDGLHFTPAMSARALMSDQRVIEVPMAYAERVGESKLHVLRDGVQFLLAIRDAALLYRPSRLFGLAAVACLLLAIAFALNPIEFFAANRRLEEWMIYRLLLSGLFGTSAFALASAGVLAEQILSLVYRRPLSFWISSVDRLFSGPRLLAAAATVTCAAVILVLPGLLDYARTGHITMHWSRAALAVFLLQSALLFATHASIHKVIALWQEQLSQKRAEATAGAGGGEPA